MPYLKRINSLPLINHISYKYAQVSDIGPSWSSCLLKISITAISFYWCNGTPTFNCHLMEFIHKSVFFSSPRLLVLCLVRTDLFIIYYCLFIFSKKLFSCIGFLDKCHTSVFKALICYTVFN